jgi:hypothetical protein
LPLEYLNCHFEQLLQFSEIPKWTIVPRVQQPAVCLLGRSELILELRDRPSDVGEELIVLMHQAIILEWAIRLK